MNFDDTPQEAAFRAAGEEFGFVDFAVVAPYLREELGPIESAAGMRHQEFEQPILNSTQIQRPTLHRDAVGGSIENQSIATERHLMLLGVARA